ncbi:MAG: DUF4199 domain-containing protein [Leeuwenhoekiella sp.]
MSSVRMELKWAVIFVLAGLLWVYFERLVGWHGKNIQDQALYTNLYALVAVAIYVLALYDKRNNFYGGIMTWKQGFMSGLVLTLFVTLFTPISQYIISFYITPDYFNNAIEYAVQSGHSTRHEAKSFFNFENYLLYSTLGALVMGTITSAAVALFIRKS